jgi:hypothetical protein
MKHGTCRAARTLNEICSAGIYVCTNTQVRAEHPVETEASIAITSYRQFKMVIVKLLASVNGIRLVWSDYT